MFGFSNKWYALNAAGLVTLEKTVANGLAAISVGEYMRRGIARMMESGTVQIAEEWGYK